MRREDRGRGTRAPFALAESLEPRRLLSVAPAGAALKPRNPKAPSTPTSVVVAPPVPVAVLSADRFEPNDSLAAATDFGPVLTRQEDHLSIHAPGDIDFLRFTSNRSGSASVTVQFATSLGDLDITIYDAAGQIVGSSGGASDTEMAFFSVETGQAYTVSVFGYDGATNPDYSVFINNSGTFPDDYEPNDTPATATPLGVRGLGFLPLLTINSDTDVDYFSLFAAATGTLDVTIDFLNANGNLDLFVYDASLNLLGASATTGDGEHVAVPCAAGGTYYVKIAGAAGATNPAYNLTVLAPDLPPDRYEPNDQFDQATALGTFSSRTEPGLSIHASGNADFYRFTAAATGRLIITVTFDDARGDLDLHLFDGTQNPIDNSSGETGTERIIFSAVAGKEYVLEVFGYQDSLNDAYSIAIAPPPPISADRFEPNDSFDTPYDLGVIESRQEAGLTVHAAANDDFYRFIPAATGQFNAQISFDSTFGDLDLFLYNGDRFPLRSSSGVGDFESITFNLTAGETYYLRVAGYQGETSPDYTLDVTSGPPFWLQSIGNLDYAFSGPSTAPVLTIFSGAGQLTADVTSTLSNLSLVVQGNAALTTATDQHFASLSIRDTASFALATGSGALQVTTDHLDVAPAARLDLATGALLLRDTTLNPELILLPLLRSAYHHGLWDGTGITSSSAAAASPALTYAVGYRPTPAAPESGNWTLIAYAPVGDANLDQRIDADDAAAIVLGVATGKTGWATGNFNYDTATNADDFILFSRSAFLRPAAPASAAPSPASRISAFFNPDPQAPHDLLT